MRWKRALRRRRWPNSMDHFAFIAASYGVATLGLCGLALWLLLDYRAQQRALRELEARGVRRRSEGRTP